MQKNYSLVKKSLIAFSLISALGVSAQTQGEEFYDVIFDGKPAKMSSKTGEVKFLDKNSEATTNTLNSVANVYPTSATTTTTFSNSYHSVAKGETLYSISRQYEIPVAELKKLNNISENTLSIGQELKVSRTEKTSTLENVQTTNNGFWTVEKGDTLYRIAKSTGLSVTELKTLNNLSTNILSIGQRLITKNN